MIPEHRPTRTPAPIALALARVYRIEIGRRNRAYDRGRGVERLDRPVISVGNLSTGGTGKTPLVQHIARTLIARDHCPVIAMRGYGARGGAPSDEALEHADALPGTPIVARPDRAAGLRALFSHDRGAAVDCVILDDGFQHRKIARDLDIVVIDATRPPARDALLPLGHLREPVDSLARADHIVLTHTERLGRDDARQLCDTLRAAHGIPVTPAAHAWDGIDLFRGDENPGERVAAPWLNGREVALVCGIGNPRAFVAMVEGAGAEIAARRILADHRAIDPDDIRGMLGSMGGSGERVVVMTRKDRARLAARGGGPEALGARAVIAVPRLSIRFPEGSEELDGACAGVF